MENKSILVSVLMTAYNRQKYIAEAIESVLASTYTNFELIIVDDCSSDKTVEIAQKFAAKDDRIKLYVNERNLDQFPNRNKAASYAKGSLLMCVDSDDTIKPDGIEYVVEQFALNVTANFAIVYGQQDIIKPQCLNPVENLRKHFFHSNHLLVGPGGTVIRTDYFKQIGGFPVKYGPVGDCYYNMKAASNSQTILLPYIFFNYRVHDSQELSRIGGEHFLGCGYRYVDDVISLPEFPLSDKEKKDLLLKNKRKFLLNSLRYLKNTRNLKKTFKAYKIAGFGFTDIWYGIFQI